MKAHMVVAMTPWGTAPGDAGEWGGESERAQHPIVGGWGGGEWSSGGVGEGEGGGQPMPQECRQPREGGPQCFVVSLLCGLLVASCFVVLVLACFVFTDKLHLFFRNGRNNLKSTVFARHSVKTATDLFTFLLGCPLLTAIISLQNVTHTLCPSPPSPTVQRAGRSCEGTH